MRLRNRGGAWYDFVLIGIAALIVYPDKVLEWAGERTGRSFGWLHLILLEVIAIALMIGATLWLMPMYPKLEWWRPLLFVGMVAAFRVVLWAVTRMFGFDD